MDTYHGTSTKFAAVLASGGVDVSHGGGELGQGFYTGEHLYLAKAWSFQMTGDKRSNVVEFSKPDATVDALSIHLLDHGPAALKRKELRRLGQTRTYQFGVDMVWAPIVGNERISGDQCKWESKVAESLLNGADCKRAII